MDNKLAFVLSGGGSRGALQIGALQALLEYGWQPDLLVGTSVGSLNSAFLALYGFSKESLDRMVDIWHAASRFDLLPKNYVRMALRRMLGRSTNNPADRLREFIISQGITPEMLFTQLENPKLVVVSADLNTGRPVLHGTAEDECILDALMLSTALPPWFLPVRKQDAYLVDGGMVSNLPIEAALHLGATLIVALDLMDSRTWQDDRNGVSGFFGRLTYSVERRYTDLELELAEARGVPTLYLGLSANLHIPFWDFDHTDEMLEQGYAIARRILDDQQPAMLTKFNQE